MNISLKLFNIRYVIFVLGVRCFYECIVYGFNLIYSINVCFCDYEIFEFVKRMIKEMVLSVLKRNL